MDTESIKAQLAEKEAALAALQKEIASYRQALKTLLESDESLVKAITADSLGDYSLAAIEMINSHKALYRSYFDLLDNLER